MEVWESHKLTLFIFFVVPGFISLKIYELLFPKAPKDTTQQLIDAIAYSSINYAILIFPIFIVETGTFRQLHPYFYMSFYLFAMFATPVLTCFAYSWARRTEFMQQFFPHPTLRPWDLVFGNRKTYWVIVTRKDGTKIGGLHGGNSFTSNSPAPDEIYLEQHWEMNSGGGLERARTDTEGILILAGDISTIEFFKYRP
jgi:hypothetical protein